MAKGDVILKFDADTGTAVQEFLKIKRAIEAAASSSREFGEDSAKAGDKASGAFGKIGQSAQAMAGSVAGTIGTFLSVGAAIKLATETANAYFDMMHERGQKALAEAKSLNSQLSGAGQGAIIPQIRSFIDSKREFKGMTVNRSETESMAGNMAAHIGTKLGDATEQELKNAIDFSLTRRAAGVSPEKATESSNTYLDMAALRNDGGFANTSNTQLQMAAMRLGTMSGREMEILSKSKNFDETLNLMIGGRQSDLRAKTLNSLLEESQGIDPAAMHELEHKARKSPGKITDEDRSKYYLGGLASDEDRLHAILDNPLLAPANQRGGIEALKRGLENASPLRTPDEELNNYTAHMDEATRLARQRQNVDADSANADRLGALDQAAKANRKGAIDAQLKTKHPLLYSVPGFAAAEEAGQVNFGMAPTFNDAIDPQGKIQGADITQANVSQVNHYHQKQLDKLVDLMQQNNEHTQNQTAVIQQQGRSPMLSNNHPGQR